MKYVLFFLFFIVTACQDSNVYICTGSTAYAYHKNRDCEGLNHCGGSILKVSLSEAKAKGRTKPCGYCYGEKSKIRTDDNVCSDTIIFEDMILDVN